uniref:Uncharacterized protein n=1 Tax=Panagrolaimus davidi TaxID=227884 RepID=A0A914PY94_9BILA
MADTCEKTLTSPSTTGKGTRSGGRSTDRRRRRKTPRIVPIKPDDQYKQELKQYEESFKEIPKIGPDETFDFEDLVMRRREKAVAAVAAEAASSPTTPAASTPGN